MQRRLGGDVIAHANTAYVSDAEDVTVSDGFQRTAAVQCQIAVAPVILIMLYISYNNLWTQNK